MAESNEREAHMTVVAINYTLSVMSGKWKWLIIGILHHFGVKRYGELKAMLTKCSHKVLSQQLRDLELDGIIVRNSYNEIPPRVEYAISDKGDDLLPVLSEMLEWGRKYMEYDEAALKLFPLDVAGNKRGKRSDGPVRAKKRRRRADGPNSPRNA